VTLLCLGSNLFNHPAAMEATVVVLKIRWWLVGGKRCACTAVGLCSNGAPES
jgi:hypothetical protein